MKQYRGERTIDGIAVTVDGRPLDPLLSRRRFSASGFEWSYEGAAPQQLAFALLADHWADPARAERHCRDFMRSVVANLGNEWEMTGADIDAAAAALGTGKGG